MAIFQKSVLNKFIKSQDSSKIDTAYLKFSKIFLQADRQAEIRTMKEEEYQDGFLDDLFVNILGYIKRPNTGYNLVREKKNEADSKKADGAILKNDSPLAVIELKGTETTDLDKVTNQGFGYKNNHKECVYVVISNFEKLRFFIHHAVDYIEFNLFTLTKEEFTTLWLCLHSENLLDNIPAKIKAESVVKEEDITKNLYKDYSSFKQELWQDIVKSNPSGDPLVFYKKTQKLIDRFLFIFFAEDAGLLPPNSISRMVDRWKMLKEEDAYKPLYEIFKQYFGYINTGRPGKTPQDEIFAYNGGLMAEDEVLETVLISDEVLLKHVSRLTTYDFSSEVDVNILGHIFENSLNDIEAVTAQLEGQEIDKSKTKRKKDGVFYTPKYITKYIVDNTVGKLCDEKKAELNIIDEEYAKGRTNRKKETLKKLDENLQAYRNWLLNITICDPACGSGAFLNQALEYLMEEHRYIDELESQLLGAGFTFPGVENHILENNIFGVDINEESIEIAKLSLWLRTAQRGRKLTSLNNNIKCGNSLIDDPEVAGEKAFNWHQEFPMVFEKGGFDVVIGNPPYVTNKLGKKNSSTQDLEMDFFKLKFGEVVEYKGNLFSLFIVQSHSIINQKGVFSFIIPNSILFNDTFKNIRKFIRKNFGINEVCNLMYEPFHDANTGGCLIFNFGKTKTEKLTTVKEVKDQDNFINKNYTVRKIDYNENIEITGGKFLTNQDSISIIKKAFNSSVLLGDIVQFYQGIITGDNKKFISTININATYKPILRGADIQRYSYTFNENYVLFDKNLLWSNTNETVFETSPKLINRQTSSNLIVAYDESKMYSLDSTHCQTLINSSFSLKYLLCLENSKLLNHIYNFLVYEGGRAFAQVKTVNLKKLPIQKCSEKDLIVFNAFADKQIESINQLSKLLRSLIELLKSKFNISNVSKKLENWDNLSFSEFLIELDKSRKEDSKEINIDHKKLSLSDEAEWMQYFNEQKQKSIELKTQIDQTDKEIDKMVYELYGLTEEEIKIVENN
jgi:type I restriction-modification system DNA methylase subunit